MTRLYTDFATDWDAPFWRLVHPEALSGCWLWHGYVNERGYGRANRNLDGRQAPLPAHKRAWVEVHGEVPAGLFVCHRCDVPACVNPDHLFLGTPAENMADMVRKGRAKKPNLGKASRQRRLSNEQAAEVRRRCAAGEPQSALARTFGVSPQSISRIHSRQIYRVPA